jgi:hypothetical protein
MTDRYNHRFENPFARSPFGVDPDGYIARRTTEAGRLIAIVPLTFQRVRVTASDPGDQWGWSDGY